MDPRTGAEAAATSRYTGGVWNCSEFDAVCGEEWFRALPASAAVFVVRARDEGGEPYVSKTANLRRRLERLLGAAKEPSQSRRLNLRERARAVEWHEVGSDFEAGFALYRRLREEFPQSYAKRLHLRPAPLVQMLRENAYPRLAVSGRIRSVRAGGEYFGPFASRAEAEQYASDSLDFFLLRRCTEELRPDPSFPGCMYSEMKMCLAPCFGGCTDERYADEAARVARYLETRGHSLVVEIGRLRDAASARLEFEAAAAAHARLERLQAVRGRIAEIVRRIDRLNGVLLQPSHLPGHIALFRIAGGMMAGPVAFDASGRKPIESSQSPEQTAYSADTVQAKSTTRSAYRKRGAAGASSQSMEVRIQEALRRVAVAAPTSAQEWMEHLAILKRWYYRSNKVGEIFIEDEQGTLPMRRVVRAVGRVLTGEKPTEESKLHFISEGHRRNV